ncbi:MAG: hypothetical protein ACK4NS_11630 [Saprospiraceae bacterium]
MIFKQLFAAMLFAALFSLAACHKDDHNHNDNDTEAPVLVIKKPTEGQLVSGMLHIELTVSDKSLHELRVEVIRESDGMVIVSDKAHVHNKKEHTYNKEFSLSMLSEESRLSMKVQVEDHSNNKTERTIKFNAKP